MHYIYEKITHIFDPLHYWWEHDKMFTKIAIGLIVFFLGSLVLIQMNRMWLLPEPLATIVPKNHFYAVSAAFTVVLILEVISLIFTLPCSFSRSVGKQFEILSLILIRNAFKELSTFSEPITFIDNKQSVLYILSDGFGALLIFALLGFYYSLQKKTSDESLNSIDLYGFVAAKKGIALLLLGLFIFMGLNSIFHLAIGLNPADFLHEFYTDLILTDILVVLISQCFQPSFFSVFRNSGFAFSTLIIRLALAAPPYYNVMLGIAAAVFAILLTKISSTLFIKSKKQAVPST